MTVDLEHVKKLPPAWWSAVVGAAAAGAILVPGSRVIAGAGAGVGMLLFALYVQPCCEGCAQGKGCGDTAAASSPAPEQAAAIAVPLARTDAGTDPSKILADGEAARAVGAVPDASALMKDAQDARDCGVKCFS